MDSTRRWPRPPVAPRSRPPRQVWTASRLGLLGICAAGVLACSGLTSWPPLDDGPGTPWRLVTGPRLFTGDPDLPFAEALVIDRSGRIVEVRRPGQGDPRRAATGERLETVHLPGALATPGLGDGHVHLRWLASLPETLDLSGLRDAASIAEAVASFAVASTGTRHLTGHGWDDAPFAMAPDWAEALRDLDPDGRPIALTRADGHALWLDPRALALLEARGLLDAPGQRVARDAAGSPTGLIVDPHLDVWDALREPLDPARQEARFATALQDLMGLGLFEVHDMAAAAADLAPLSLALDGLSEPLRVVVYLEASEPSWRWLEAHAPGPVDLGPRLRVQGVKLFADGALGSRGAALHAPYADAPAERGQGLGAEQLLMDITRAMALGFDVAVHAIGDAAVDAAAEGIAASLQAARAGGVRGLGSYRPRIEHVQVLSPEGIAALSRAGALASMQPEHALQDASIAPARLGPARLRRAYAARQLLGAGVPLVLGSDAPIAPSDPLVTLRAAVLRGGAEAPEWVRAEAIPAGAAIAGMSAALALATGEEGARGRLKVGMPLTLTLFDRDFVTDPTRLDEAAVLGRAWCEEGQVRVSPAP